MGDIIKIFNCHFVLFYILICFPVSQCTNFSTICYGVPGQPCLTHRLSCPSPLVIQIINTTYGYRPGCNNYIGLSSCINTTCCNEEPGDCFIQFSSKEHQEVLGNCSGVQSCELWKFRRYNTTHTVCNGRIVSAYSKIEYDCVSKDKTTFISSETTLIHTNSKTSTTATLIHTSSKPSTTATLIYTNSKPTTSNPLKSLTTIAPTTGTSTPTLTKVAEETATTTHLSRDLTSSTSSSTQSSQCLVSQTDNSGVVGGVLGTLFIISVIINVGLVVYFTRKMKSLTSTPRENNYDGITNTGRDQTLPTYDVLQVQSVASSDNDDKKKSDSNHTYYNTKGDSLSRDIDPYYVNMKKP